MAKNKQAGHNAVLLAYYIGGIFKMTIVQKNEIISKVILVLSELLDTEYDKSENDDTYSNGNQPVELLTVKECAEAVSGLSEHTIRLLVSQDKIPCIRTGTGKRGKILINKSVLFDYLKNIT